MSQGTFSDLLIQLEAFKRIIVYRPKMDFFPRFWVKNEQIFKSAFFTPLCPCRKTFLRIILKCKYRPGKELKEFSFLPLS